MSDLKVIVQKGDMPYDFQSVGKYGKFIGISEMPIDILLFSIRAGSSQ